MLRRDDFVPGDICAESMLELEKIATTSSETKYLSKISGKRTMANKKLGCI
jgi:hypothetical protein